jgi:hypothetical protein
MTTKSKTNLLKSSDFQSFEYSIIMKNLLSQNEIQDSRKIKIAEFIEKGMILQMPVQCCVAGHNLMLAIVPGRFGVKVTQFPKQATELKGCFLATCKVTLVESAEKPGFSLYTIEFLQVVEKEWLAFMKKFSNAQAQVNKIFKM